MMGNAKRKSNLSKRDKRKKTRVYDEEENNVNDEEAEGHKKQECRRNRKEDG